MVENTLNWQSKLILLAVLPFVGVEVVLDCGWWAAHTASVALWTIGLSALLGLVTWMLRAVTPLAALAGASLTASLMFSTTFAPHEPWHTALIPMLAVSLLAFAATRVGRRQKERLAIAEGREGRSASQIAANLGLAAVVAIAPVQNWLMGCHWLSHRAVRPGLSLALIVAALAEAAADTVSSEIGQVLGGRPRMITSFKAVEAGRDGAISLAGSFAGAFAAAIVAWSGMWALGGGWEMFALSCAGAVFGLFFDSLLGATFESRGRLNNDAVNFLSTAGAAGFALALLRFV